MSLLAPEDRKRGSGRRSETPLTSAYLVGVMQFRLNEQLARYLRERDTQAESACVAPVSTTRVSSYHAPTWRVRDRLSQEDLDQLVAAFKAGTPKHVLAERYGIGIKSVKGLLRERGVRRRSKWDMKG
jgi:hypothetical protein